MSGTAFTPAAGTGPVRIRTVLFDLDGTLLDTAPDLADALNTVLVEQNHPPLPFDAIRPVVSHGGIALIELGFRLARSDPAFEPLRQRLLAVYRANLSGKTRPFAGTETLLDALEARGLNWGVVTNKPGWLTEPLLQDLGLFERAACVVSGDTLTERKPHPAPMLLACRQAGSDRRNACTSVTQSAMSRPAGTPACTRWWRCSVISRRRTTRTPGRPAA